MRYINKLKYNLEFSNVYFFRLNDKYIILFYLKRLATRSTRFKNSYVLYYNSKILIEESIRKARDIELIVINLSAQFVRYFYS
jgi:hypothetical protein